MKLGLLLFTLSSFLLAEAGLNFAQVDLQYALETVEAGKTAKTKLEKEAADKKAELDKLEKEFKAKAEAFEKKTGLMNEAARLKSQQDLQKEYIELQRKFSESQMSFQQRQREVTKPLIEQLKGVVATIGKEKNYHFILEKNSEAVLYAQNATDITSDVINRFNEQNKKKSK